MQNGNLKSYINSNQCSTEEKYRWVKQTADAIEVFHIITQKAAWKLDPAIPA
jgi:hypothetical protein